MKVFILFALGFSVASAGKKRVVDKNPLAAVISLLDSLSAKIKKEGEDEAKAYAEFVEWCDDAAKNKGFEIKTATSKKEKLETTISVAESDADAASTKVEELAASITGNDKDLTDATLIREKEAADFKANEAELMDMVDTLGRAISVLEREMAKNPAAFNQVDTSNLDSTLKALSVAIDAASFSLADKKKLTSLVQAQQKDDDFQPGAPAAASYKSHSTNILDVLEDMKEKAEEQLSELRKAEANTKHNYNMLKQSLEDQISADNKAMEDEKATKATAEETKATAEGELANTVKDLANAKETLGTCQSDCMSAAADHDATLKGREEELKVIATAKDILQSSSQGAVEQTYSLIQQDTEVHSRLRTRSDLAAIEVVEMVKRLAKEQHSAALTQLASRIGAIVQYGAAAGEDPFKKVKELIQAMLEKLQKQANEEADEKAYCDEQMAKTEEKKSELEDDVAKLTSKIDTAAAKSASLKGDVQELQAELASLAKAQAQMDKIRMEENKAYQEAKADLEQGLAGVRKALGVLRDYYGGASAAASAAAAAMLQDSDGSGLSAAMQQPSPPETHEKASGAGSSIIDILQVVESDFAKNLASEEAEEADSASEYEKTSQENKVTKALKTQDVKYKTQEFIGLDKSLSEMQGDLKSTSTELDAVLDYYAKIKSRCIAKPETYEERKKSRAAEIKGLKEALQILENETAFTQHRKRGLRSHFLA